MSEEEKEDGKAPGSFKAPNCAQLNELLPAITDGRTAQILSLRVGQKLEAGQLDWLLRRRRGAPYC
jgi:hypothetical protein